MKVALAQINSHLGNFAENARKILDFSQRAQSEGAEVVVFPEASLFGYHPMDLLERPAVVHAQLKISDQLCRDLPREILVIFGAFTLNKSRLGKPYFNSAMAVTGGRARLFNKTLLPTYDVFDDARHIEPGDVAKNILKFRGKKILVTVCEDIWAWPLKNSTAERRSSLYDRNPLKTLRPGPLDLIVNLSASPFFQDKWSQRLAVVRATARHFKAPMTYVNMVGGQDELIFDGGSFAVDARGEMLAHSPHFQEHLQIVETQPDKKAKPQKRELATRPDGVKSLQQALVLGVHDFLSKTGLERAHLGLSGGIDSAVVAALAVDAVGPERVTGIALPGPYSSKQSLDLAERLAKNLKIQFKVVEFTHEYEAIVALLERNLQMTGFGVAQENIQARLRGLILMAFSNQKNSLLLNTTNKTEMAAGYGTLYGDLCGGLAVIGDLLKKDVYDLAALYNRESELIPQQIISRAPSAELRPNQRDQDTLPPYEELDASVVRLVEKSVKVRSATDQFLLTALTKSEFKRWQSPPILKVRAHSFGQGRRMPIANSAIY